MSTTDILGFTLLEASQAQKHVTVNEALVEIDHLLQLSVNDKFINTPPVSPVGGDRYIIGGTPTGAWSGMAYKIAASLDGVWKFYTPKVGFTAFNQADGVVYIFNAAFQWVGLQAGFQAYCNYAQSLTAAITNLVAFNNTDHNAAGAFVAASNKFVAPTNGLYSLGASLQLTPTAATAGSMVMNFAKNGTALDRGAYTKNVADTNTHTLTSALLLNLVAGDYITVLAGHSAVTSTVVANKNSFYGMTMR